MGLVAAFRNQAQGVLGHRDRVVVDIGAGLIADATDSQGDFRISWLNVFPIASLIFAIFAAPLVPNLVLRISYFLPVLLRPTRRSTLFISGATLLQCPDFMLNPLWDLAG